LWRFSTEERLRHPLHQSTNYAIDLDPGNNLPYVRVFNLLEFNVRMLKAYIKANLANRFIECLSSPVVAPMLFAKKKDTGLKL